MESVDKTLWQTSFERFQKVCSPLRNISLFKWLSDAYQFLYLSSVEEKLISKIVDLKTSLCIIDVAVDDACDNTNLIRKMGGEEFTYRILDLLYSIDKIIDNKKEKTYPANKNGAEYYDVLYKIMEDTINALKMLPRFEDFKQEFIFSVRNVGCAMEFSYLVNKGQTIYPLSYIVEQRSPSTMVTVHSIIDLMASPEVDKQDVGKIIPLLNMADTVAMLSNTLNTWPREILEKDYSSPLLALALERGIITFEEFHNKEPAEIEKRISFLSEVIESMIDEKLDEMYRYVKSNGIQHIDAIKYVENYRKIKDAFKARERYWEKSMQ